MTQTMKAGDFIKKDSQQKKAIQPLKQLALAMMAHQTNIPQESFVMALSVIHHEAILREDSYLFEDRGDNIELKVALEVVDHCVKQFDVYQEKGYRIAVGLQADKAIGVDLTMKQFEKYNPRTMTFGLNYQHRTSEQQKVWLDHLRVIAN